MERERNNREKENEKIEKYVDYNGFVDCSGVVVFFFLLLFTMWLLHGKLHDNHMFKSLLFSFPMCLNVFISFSFFFFVYVLPLPLNSYYSHWIGCIFISIIRWSKFQANWFYSVFRCSHTASSRCSTTKSFAMHTDIVRFLFLYITFILFFFSFSFRIRFWFDIW